MTVYRPLGPPEQDSDSWAHGSLALRHEGAAMRGMAACRDARDDALTQLLDDPELFGLAGVLEPDRADRLRWRAQRMLDLGIVLLKSVV